MVVCPLDFRYGRKPMKALFSEDAKLQRMLDVEAALARAHAKFGDIPAKAASDITRAADVKTVTVERVAQLEREIGHDVMAVVVALSEKAGDSGRFVHLGATSNDITDTATALQLQEALGIVREDLNELKAALLVLAKKHRKTVMLGRTHGQAAVPITFGLKMAVFALEVDRHLARLGEAWPRICVGKMSGAVGTGAAFGPHALDVQEDACEELGVAYEEASGQVVGRDRYAELITMLANVAASAEKFATEVRNLQRTEIGEAAEAFGEKQVGSSTMANKENPVTSENVCGLARIVRAFVIPALEDVPLWHERDLTNSAAERIMLPHALILADDLLAKSTDVFRNLRVYPERMRANLAATKGQVMAESVMIALVGKGLGRQEAHKLVQDAAKRARKEDAPLRDALVADAKIAKALTKKEIDAALDPDNYLGASVEIVDRILKKYA
ncbi:MAG: adenylosuccinate lyase [Methanobacteriota archaeon]|nr:MAG: adenylosuccinate lyase [Euryarchaeota archaeon]